MFARFRIPAHLRPVVRTEGWLSLAQAQRLYELARDCSDGCIVEVGSYRGRSTVALALGAEAGSSPAVYAIEPHEPFVGELGGRFGPEDRGAFYRNMIKSGLYRTVRLVNLPSSVVTASWEQPVGLLWLDGDHSYEGVRSDFELWEPHLAPGATIAFHDADDPNLGPHRLIGEIRDVGRYKLLSQGELSVVQRA